MTIYKTRAVDKKDVKDGPAPEVFPDLLPGEKKKDEEVLIPPQTIVRVAPSAMRPRTCSNLCLMVTAILVLVTGVMGGIYLYKHLAHRTFTGWCGVRYFENQFEEADGPDAVHQRAGQYKHYRHQGKFEEYVELDKTDGKYERFDVPQFEDCEKATVLHDFERNMTAIVDRDHFRCFLMPLNRTIIKPPSDFWDMLSKLSSGYYMPDVEVVRERYVVIHPPIKVLSPFGYYIWRECHRLNTYMMERIGPNDPVAMVKRDTSAAEHPKFAVAGGYKFLPVIEIEGL